LQFLLSSKKHRIPGAGQGFDKQLAVVINNFNVLSRDQNVPRRRPRPRLPADHLTNARFQAFSPAVIGLLSLGYEVRHEKNQEPKIQEPRTK
jgi:hypothetical protein